MLAAPALPPPVRLPHIGIARDGETIALLMPDLTGTLIRWEQPIEPEVLGHVLAALSALHGQPWHEQLGTDFPWTDRAPPAAPDPGLGRLVRRSRAAVRARFLQGWERFMRSVPARASNLVRDSAPTRRRSWPLLDRLPNAGLHGDLKLGNVGLADDGTVWMIDWQMTLVGPIAVELGWFLVANVAGLPMSPDAVLERYRLTAGVAADDDWAAQRDLAIVTGMLLRGWRKGLDADAGLTLQPEPRPPRISPGGPPPRSKPQIGGSDYVDLPRAASVSAIRLNASSSPRSCPCTTRGRKSAVNPATRPSVSNAWVRVVPVPSGSNQVMLVPRRIWFPKRVPNRFGRSASITSVRLSIPPNHTE